VTSVAGKGIIADGHRLSLGATLARPATQARIEAADVVLAVGTELAETDHWLPGRLPIKGGLIRIDIDPGRLADTYAAAVPILADAGAALAALSGALGVVGRDPGAANAEVAAILAQIRTDEAPLRRRHRTVLEAVRHALPDDAIVASDMTQLAYSANEIFPVARPRCWLHPVGFGTLGYAVPAAIGAQLACPGRAVAAIVGDYGFQYTMNELATATEHKLPIVVVLWNNRALGQIREDMLGRRIEPLGTDAPGPDFAPLARAFGCAYAQPGTPAAIEAAIAEALVHDRPTIIELVEAVF
jgi:5-guanidino-2-oxopentanoate decarboxylase